jgi:hypothetical protein
MRANKIGLNNDGLILAQLRGLAVIRTCSAMFRLLAQSLKLLLQFLEIVIREVFQIDELIARAFHGAN